jgi:hypothetical protein
MFTAMNAESAVHFDLRLAALSNSTLHTVWRKNGVRVARGFQNVLVHLAVTRTVSRLSTSHIDRDLTACLTGARIEADVPPFDLKGPVHGVKKSAQSKSHGALRRIEFDLHQPSWKSRIFCRRQAATEADQQEVR